VRYFKIAAISVLPVPLFSNFSCQLPSLAIFYLEPSHAVAAARDLAKNGCELNSPIRDTSAVFPRYKLTPWQTSTTAVGHTRSAVKQRLKFVNDDRAPLDGMAARGENWVMFVSNADIAAVFEAILLVDDYAAHQLLLPILQGRMSRKPIHQIGPQNRPDWQKTGSGCSRLNLFPLSA
jgi:hypothetical protein